MTDAKQRYLAQDYIDDQDILAIPYDESGLVDISFDDVTPDLAAELTEVFKSRRDVQRRRAELERKKAERRATKITKAFQRLNLTDEWFVSTGERIQVKSMTPRHAARSLNLLTNDFGRWIGDRDITYSDLGMPVPFKDAPIVKALTKQSKVRETKKHRARDELTDSVFRAAASGGKLHLWEIIEDFTKVHSG
jgi:hypothetical protein